jgi:hypothetical protein
MLPRFPKMTKGERNDIDMDENMMAKAYTLRTLTADDMFPMFNIVSKIGIREIKNCFSPATTRAMLDSLKGDDGDREEKINAVGVMIGMDVLSVIMERLPACRDDLYQLLSQLSGMDKKEIGALPMPTFAEMIIDVIRKEEFKDFFGVVSKLLK